MPVSLITGGSTGIGAAIARELLVAGHSVVVTGRNKDRLAALGEQLRDGDGRLVAMSGDASDFDAVQAAVDTAVDRFGQLDNVVANAGFTTHDNLAEGDPEHWRAMVLTNVLGPMLLVKAALPALKQSKGRIVFVGSVAGIKNVPGNMYSVTKWATTGMAENTRLFVTGLGVGVTLLAPGRVDTPFWDSHDDARPSEGPVLTAEDIARSVVWVLGQPAGVDVNTLVVRPVGQDI
ncbi:MAG: SDR family oxidoreductase [Pseudonocardiaceae bacterium]